MFRRLTVNGDGSVTFTAGDGSRHTFTAPSGGTIKSYTRPATLYADLTRDTGATPDRFSLTWRDRSLDLFDELVANTGYLVREEDRFGNGVTLAYTSGNLTSITDTAAGRAINLAWTSGTLTSITDWANVSGGVVQTSGSGNRVHRFFYSGGNLAGWADPLNTSGSCPTGGSHLTCLTSSATQLDVTKTQTYTTIAGSPAALGSATRTATTRISFANGEVTTVKDAQEVQDTGAGTAFSHPAGIPLNKALISEVVLALGCIPLTEYGTPGTSELSDQMRPFIANYDALLLANHGVVTYGVDLEDAFNRMDTVEHFAKISVYTRILGQERLLSSDDVEKLWVQRQKYFGLDPEDAKPKDPFCPLTDAAAPNAAPGKLSVTRDELIDLIEKVISDLKQ
jgi:hypothetical protein